MEEQFDFVVDLDPTFNSRMDGMRDQLRMSPHVLTEVKEVAIRLIDISQGDSDMSEDRKGFLAEELKDEIRNLGQKLYDLGGLTLMQYVVYCISQFFKHPSDQRCLDFAWDGIGEWRC